MAENLTERYAGYAVYLPSLQKQYAHWGTKDNNDDAVRDVLPAGFDVSDLNFLNPKKQTLALWKHALQCCTV